MERPLKLSCRKRCRIGKLQSRRFLRVCEVSDIIEVAHDEIKSLVSLELHYLSGGINDWFICISMLSNLASLAIEFERSCKASNVGYKVEDPDSCLSFAKPESTTELLNEDPAGMCHAQEYYSVDVGHIYTLVQDVNRDDDRDCP